MQSDFQNDYTIGRGKTYFDKFLPNSNRKTGEMYFGNGPEFTITTDTENLDHYASDYGLRVKDASVLLEAGMTGTFTCDNIAAENLALWFLGDLVNMTLTDQTGVKEVFKPVLRGKYYQIGTSDDTPTGLFNVDNVVVAVADGDVEIIPGAGDITSLPGVAVVNAAGNYELDLAQGRIYIEPDSPVFAGNKQMIIQCDIAAQNRNMVIGKTNQIYGALRYIADNPVGTNKNYYFPKVALRPDGDYALKGDDWNVMSFSFEALQLNNITQRLYIDVLPSAATVDPTTLRTVSVSLASTSSASGGSGIVATATVRDGNGTVVQGETVNFTTDTGATVTPASASTASTGQATTTLKRSTAGTAKVTATLANGKSAVSQTATFS
ncbi:major tail protein [Klebsiella phage Soft]|uniref:Major tail protein n=1 Tax=Klebsiella phage Soft TaxID=2601626 RepID=A0A5C1K9F6_9CAUD|nr:major tail protein with Ig-like domain [Klebsiella phage Soft]QEM42183.1 major tail protein [Klebsiella phage Soft]